MICWEANNQGKMGSVGFWAGCPQVTPQCLGDARQRSGEFPSQDESAVSLPGPLPEGGRGVQLPCWENPQNLAKALAETFSQLSHFLSSLV